MLKETVFSYILNGSKVYSAFLDFSKAFDKVNFNVLFKRMIDLNFPVQYVKFIHNWYIKQYVRVTFDGAMSGPWKIRNGVRQGGILSPFLFNIYIDVLLEEVTSLSVGCKLGHFMSNIIAYADDVVVLAPSITALQRILDTCSSTAKLLKLNFNTKKSVCMQFHKNCKISDNSRSNNFRIGNDLLQNVNEVVYLGFNITSNMCNNKDIIRERNKFYNRFNSILRKFYSVNLDVFLVLFKSFCFSFYGCELWFRNFNCKLVLKSFSVGFHKSVKKIIGVPWCESNYVVCEALGL